MEKISAAAAVACETVLVYIEFVPYLNANYGAVFCLINEDLARWSKTYSVVYRTKTVKNRKRVTFDNDAFYSLFVMTWPRFETAPSLSKWRLISDPNNKT